jgi:16S rRNA U1498 N3-methylase RsmE
MVYRLVISPPLIGQNQVALNAEQIHYLWWVLRLEDTDRALGPIKQL